MDSLFELTQPEKCYYKDLPLARFAAIINKVNEIVEVINSLECDNPLITPVQERGGSDA
jgi:hypothetical protein